MGQIISDRLLKGVIALNDYCVSWPSQLAYVMQH